MSNFMSAAPLTDTTLTQNGVPADAKTVGDALIVVKGMLKVERVELSGISVNVNNDDYFYARSVSFADKIPANAIVLAVTASDWGHTTCGSMSVYTNTINKSIQITANKSGSVGSLYLDVLYIEKDI